MKNHGINRKLFITGKIALMLLVFLIACAKSTAQETLPSSTLPLTLDIGTETVNEEPPIPPIPESLTTPTARVFTEGDNCIVPNGLVGHILFLQQNMVGARNHASYYDLYVMDGNGCFPGFVMAEVSGSPTWSANGKQIAVGCENNAFICILDAKVMIDSCSGPENEIGQCNPAILQEIALPSTIAGNKLMYNLSWSPDGSEIAVEGGDEVTGERLVYLLTLASGGMWEILIERKWASFDMVWSPKDARLAFSGLFLMNPDGSNKLNPIEGGSPEWSPNGKEIAFLKPSGDETKEFSGIASINIDNGEWEWLYEPANRDKHYWPSQNLAIRDDRDHRLLSWSPDGQHIAFVSLYRFEYDSQIFRLDLATHKITVLTANLRPKEGDHYYFAPAWGP